MFGLGKKERLFQVILRGDLEAVKSFNLTPRALRARDGKGRTLLHLAVIIGANELVEYLLGIGADIESKDKQGRTPLHWAIISRKPDIARLLLNKGADCYSETRTGVTPLMFATATDQPQLVELLRKYDRQRDLTFD